MKVQYVVCQLLLQNLARNSKMLLTRHVRKPAARPTHKARRCGYSYMHTLARDDPEAYLVCSISTAVAEPVEVLHRKRQRSILRKTTHFHTLRLTVQRSGAFGNTASYILGAAEGLDKSLRLD
jgi:hypothetical protein